MNSPAIGKFAISFAEAQLALANLLAPADGKKHFLRAVEILEPLAETDPAARWKLASSYYTIAFAKGGFGLAPGESYCARAISLLESLAREDPSTYNHDLARAVYNLALRDAGQGKLDAAERGYRRCLQIWGESSSGAWSDSDQEGIAACQEALGTMLQARGQASAQERGGIVTSPGRRFTNQARSPSSPPPGPPPRACLRVEQPGVVLLERSALPGG